MVRPPRGMLRTMMYSGITRRKEPGLLFTLITEQAFLNIKAAPRPHTQASNQNSFLQPVSGFRMGPVLSLTRYRLRSLRTSFPWGVLGLHRDSGRQQWPKQLSRSRQTPRPKVSSLRRGSATILQRKPSTWSSWRSTEELLVCEPVPTNQTMLHIRASIAQRGSGSLRRAKLR